MTFTSEIKNKLVISGEDNWELLDTAWDDLRFPVTAINPPGQVSDPTFNTTYVGYEFAPGSTEILYIIAQLPHSYKEGSDIRPHLHWMPTNTNTGDVLWRMEYAWQSNGGVQPSFTTVDITSTASGTAYQQHINSFGAISKPDSLISDILSIKLSRIGGDGSDTYSADALLKEFDIHYQINTAGSRQEFIK
jgi:hypothetical protein